MVRLRNLSLKSKLLLMLLPVGLLSMGVQAGLGQFNGTQAQLRQGIETMVAVRQSKKQQIESFFRNLRDTFPIFGDDVAVVAAAAQFRDAFGQLGRTRLADERRKGLERFYQAEFLPSLAEKRGDSAQVLMENVWPRTDRSIEAQALFIAENQFKIGEKSKLLDHPIANPYTLAHFTYHGWFRDVMQRLKLHDLMLADADSGSIIYSVEKEADFGTSLQDGPYANTNVGRLFRRVLAEHKKGFVAFSDFDIYTASGLIPAMFVATPVYTNFKLTGVLIGQISVDELNRTLNGTNSWKQDGLGNTGLAYVVGPQRLMRSNHRFFIEDKNRLLDQLKANGSPESKLADLRKSKSTILKLAINVEAVERAERGETGTMIGRNVINQPSVQAFAPLDIPDLNWVLVTQMNQSEVLAPVRETQKQLMVLACVLALATALASMFMASRFLRPVNRLIDTLAARRSGGSIERIEPASTDEFGKLTADFNEISDQLKARDAQIAEKTERNGQLLKRLFPNFIVERLLKGETQIVDDVPNVTVIYASVIGFVKAVEGKTPTESMALLNELFDVFDQQAELHGIDRVKTLGENYIAACGLTETRLDHAQRSLAFCDAISVELKRLALDKNIQLGTRVSLASGDIQAGLVGDRRFVFEIWGRPLNFARRLVHEAATEEIRITEMTYGLLGANNGFSERPTVEGRSLGSIRNFGRRLSDSVAKVEAAPKRRDQAAA